MGKRNPRQWTDKETQYLVDNYYLKPVGAISAELGRHIQSIVSKTKELGIHDRRVQSLLRAGN